MSEHSAAIKSIKLFAHLSEEDCEAIDELCDWRSFANGVEILHEDDRTNDVFFIAKGAVSAKSFSTTGREVTYIVIQAGEIFGEFSAIDGMDRSATVMTIADDNVIARLSAASFNALLEDHPRVAKVFARHLVAKIRALTRKVYEFSTLTVAQRIHRELERLATSTTEDGDAVVDHAPTHYELATQIATHREAVSRELSRMVKKGELSIEGRKYTLLFARQKTGNSG